MEKGVLSLPGMFSDYINIAGINFSQTLLTSTLSLLFFMLFAYIYLLLKNKNEGNFLVSSVDLMIESMDNFFGSVSDKIPLSVKAYVLFLFIYILWNNIFGLILDVFASVVPFLHHNFRPVNTDIYFNAILAIIGVIWAIVYGFKNNGFRFLERYFNFRGVGMTQGYERKGFFSTIVYFIIRFFDIFLGLFIGILELIGEFTKILSLTLRLFGNIFAGVVLIGLITVAAIAVFKVPFLFPIVVIAMELLVGILQAFIFALLVLVYFKMAEESH